MQKAILVLNAGSSSIKFSVFRQNGGSDLELDSKGQIEGIGVRPRFSAKSASGEKLIEEEWEKKESGGHGRAFANLAAWLKGHYQDQVELAAVGHRVLHGGQEYAKPIRVDAKVMEKLRSFISLGPLHQPNNLAGIDAAMEETPEIPQIACFDTAFHRGREPVTDRFALPRKYEDLGVLRYGFHGLSYEYIARAIGEQAPHLADKRVVVAHLGNGSSMCALKNGRSYDTTMGFTALDGLCMGTRTGAIDAGVLLWLLQDQGMDAKQIETLLYKESGLLGISGGLSSDMRDLLESDDPKAADAVEFFVYRIVKELGALTAAMGGLDALVFTAGIGENSAEIRKRVVERASAFGFKLDAAANANGRGCITTESSTPEVWVIPTNEELMIAQHAANIVGL